LVAQFEGSWLTTEGGALLLRQVDRKIGLLRRVARCFTDYRQPKRIAHRLEEMLAQRRSTVIAERFWLPLMFSQTESHQRIPAQRRARRAEKCKRFIEPARTVRSYFLLALSSPALVNHKDSSQQDWDQNWCNKRSENRSEHHRDSCSSALHLSLDYRLGRALPV